MSKPYRKLERSELHLISTLYMSRFKDDKFPTGGMAEHWYRVISDFLGSKYNDADIILSKTRDLEYKIMQDDTLSKEYIDCLLAIVAPGGGLLTESQRVVYLLTASNEDRERAALLTLT